uniref:THAP-type domain-containing protein n=1 Tax=Sinocyclocheilus grahami TaxID=75366 RepID=A0A672P6B4_SINGR
QPDFVPSCGKTQSLRRLPSDPSVRKEWMNFIFNEDPDRISKNLVLCSLHFSTDLFTNTAQFYNSTK